MRPGDRLGFEVITKAEVTQHLEKGNVAISGTNNVYVDGADALLRGHRPIKRGGLFSEEIGLERHHAGIGKQQCGIDRDERRRRAHNVGALGEEIHKGLANLVAGFHEGGSLAFGTTRPNPLSLRVRFVVRGQLTAFAHATGYFGLIPLCRRLVEPIPAERFGQVSLIDVMVRVIMGIDVGRPVTQTGGPRIVGIPKMGRDLGGWITCHGLSSPTHG